MTITQDNLYAAMRSANAEMARRGASLFDRALLSIITVAVAATLMFAVWAALVIASTAPDADATAQIDAEFERTEAARRKALRFTPEEFKIIDANGGLIPLEWR